MEEKNNYQNKNRIKFFKNFLLVCCSAFIYLSTNAQDTTSYCTANFSIVQNSIDLNTISINNQSTGNGLVYSWNFGDGSTSSLRNPVHTYTNDRNYTVSLKITSTVDNCEGQYFRQVSVGSCRAYFVKSDTSNGTYFSNLSFGNISDYLWDFGDGTVSNLENPDIHYYAKGGNYNVCLTVSNPKTSCTASYCHLIRVSSCYGNISYTADSIGTGISLQAIVSGNVTNYFWDFGDGTNSTDANPYHVYNDERAHKVFLRIASSTDSLCSDTINKYVSPNFLDITYTPDSIGYGAAFMPTVKGDMYNYNWTFGDGTTSTETKPYHLYNIGGLYEVCLIVTSKINPLSQSQRCILVNPNSVTCTALFSASQGKDGIGVVIQNLTTGNVTDYLWDFGDGTTSNDKEPEPHIYKNGGDYKIMLTVSNPLTSCSSFYYQMYSERDCYGTFNATIDANSSEVVFTSKASASVDEYSWDFGDGTSSVEPNPYHVYSESGRYNVSLKVSSSLNSSCSYTYFKEIVFVSPCNAKFSIVKDSINLNNVIIYYPTKANSTASYTWNFGDGGVSNLQYPTHTYANKGNYQVCLTVTRNSICTETFCDTISVGRTSEFTLTVVNPLALGIKELKPSSIGLENYPNPLSFSTTINYSIPVNGTVDLYVVDLLGNKIKSIEHRNKIKGQYSAEWIPENVANGIYLLQLKINNQLITKKIIVNK